MIFIYGYLDDLLVVKRALTNFTVDAATPMGYVNMFTSINLSMETSFRLLIGRLSSSSSPLASHNDYYNILALVGLPIFAYILWKWFVYIRFGLLSKNNTLETYAITMLVIFLGFLHHHSGFTEYVFFFFTVSLVKLDYYLNQAKHSEFLNVNKLNHIHNETG